MSLRRTSIGQSNTPSAGAGIGSFDQPHPHTAVRTVAIVDGHFNPRLLASHPEHGPPRAGLLAEADDQALDFAAAVGSMTDKATGDDAGSVQNEQIALPQKSADIADVSVLGDSRLGSGADHQAGAVARFRRRRRDPLDWQFVIQLTRSNRSTRVLARRVKRRSWRGNV